MNIFLNIFSVPEFLRFEVFEFPKNVVIALINVGITTKKRGNFF